MPGLARDLLRSPRLERAGFAHAFSTRLGGVSAPPFDALDFAVLRAPEALAENQRRIAEAVGFDVARLHQAMQVHGHRVLVAHGDPAATLKEEADALVAEPGSADAVAVRVADCVPVLLADPATGRVAAVHAGWRGVENRILAVAIERLGTSALVAAIGPSIGPCCFEVGADVAERIVVVSSPDVVDRRVGEKAFVDLRRAVRAQLRALGVADDAIDDVPGCTSCDRARFYSYRRDKDASGRLLAVIKAGPPDRRGSPP